MSTGVMLFNPFTGTPRHPDDIKSDPDGFLLWDGEARLQAARAAQQATDHVAGTRNLVTPEQAHAMGAKGAPPTEEERLLFEAWMRGHCWGLSATWDGKSYRSDYERNGMLDGNAMATRRLWAAWRDRAALGAARPVQVPGWIPVGERLPEVDSGEVLVWLTGGRCAFDEWHQYHEDPTGLGGGTMYMGDMWRDYEFDEITHWMPLPEAPDLLPEAGNMVAQSAQHTQVMQQALDALKNAIAFSADATANAYGDQFDEIRAVEVQVEEVMAELRAAIAQPAQNEWKEAVIEQLAAHSMDAPVSDSPTVILEKIIDMAVLQATDPGVNGGWKLVPVEPTLEMRFAAEMSHVRGYTDLYKAMMAAAPSPKE